MKAEVRLTGGCSGHFGEDARCYCDSEDVHVTFTCPNTRTFDYIDGKMVSRKNPCKQPEIPIGELSDQYSIGRWLTENYVPTSKP